MIEALIFSLSNFIFLLTGYYLGSTSTREQLNKKVTQIIHSKIQTESGGPVKQLTPAEKSKAIGRELMEKYGAG